MTQDSMQVVPAAFVEFFDDAATFPPGLAPLRNAVTNHVARRENQLNDAVGPAVLALKDLPEAKAIASELKLGGYPIQVSTVVPADGLQSALDLARTLGPELEVVALELKTDPDNRELWIAQISQATQVSQLPIYIELDSAQIEDGALEMLAEGSLHLKYRTGGTEPALFPSPEQLAKVLLSAVSAGIRFKLTAGLHEAVRYTNAATGITHHGFLNIAMATLAARQGQALNHIAALLSETDQQKLGDLARTRDQTWRQSFSSFGTCSVGEPAESLERLGLFPHGLA